MKSLVEGPWARAFELWIGTKELTVFFAGENDLVTSKQTKWLLISPEVISLIRRSCSILVAVPLIRTNENKGKNSYLRSQNDSRSKQISNWKDVSWKRAIPNGRIQNASLSSSGSVASYDLQVFQLPRERKRTTDHLSLSFSGAQIISKLQKAVFGDIRIYYHHHRNGDTGPCAVSKSRVKDHHPQVPFSRRPLPSSWAPSTGGTSPGRSGRWWCPPGRRSSCSCRSIRLRRWTPSGRRLQPSRRSLQSLG